VLVVRFNTREGPVSGSYPVTKAIRERKRKEAEARQKEYDALPQAEKARRNPRRYPALSRYSRCGG
jgi:hypothetical protein